MPRPLTLAVLALSLLPACSARAGWGKGAYRELRDGNDLEIRRGLVHLDATTGEFVLPWIGARVPENVGGEFLGCRLSVFRDEDGDERQDPGEVVYERESRDRAIKYLFSDVRVCPALDQGRLFVRVEVREPERTRGSQFELRVDA